MSASVSGSPKRQWRLYSSSIRIVKYRRLYTSVSASLKERSSSRALRSATAACDASERTRPSYWESKGTTRPRSSALISSRTPRMLFAGSWSGTTRIERIGAIGWNRVRVVQVEDVAGERDVTGEAQLAEAQGIGLEPAPHLFL